MINIQKNPIMGIYKIKCLTTEYNYIGQTINSSKRKADYKDLSGPVKKQPKIYESLIKYGVENHNFEIIEECSLNQLNEREIYYKKLELDEVNGDWNKVLFCNLYDTGGGPKSEETKRKMSLARKGFKCSEETKQKMRKPRREGTGSKISASNIGKIKHSEEVRAKMRINRKGKFPFQNLTKEEQNKIVLKRSLKRKGQPCSERRKLLTSKGVIQMDFDGKTIKEWVSRREVSKILNIDEGQISNCCSGKAKTAGGYTWKNK